MASTAKRTFMVGRRTARSTLIILVEDAAWRIPGPWTLEAVVSVN